MDLGLSGLASGFDWRTLVDQLIETERTPQNRLRTEQSQIQQRSQAYDRIKTQLNALGTRVDALKAGSTLFDARQISLSDSTVATASVTEGAPLGTYVFEFSQLATAAKQVGSLNIGGPLNATNDVSSLVLSNAAFANAVTAGTFTVNGKQITIQTTDTLQSVFDQIDSATSHAVTASYDAATDKITFSSASPIVLGSATDTSNFLSVAQLFNNGTGSISSSAKLGAVRSATTLANANLATSITDGGSGSGAFKINGVTINFSTTGDSLANVIDRINASSAGVLASYDAIQDRVILTNKATGDIGIALQDVTGNFLAATGLSSGALERGKNLLYTIDGGDQRTATSNIITSTSSGLTGISLTALKEGGSTEVTIASDMARIRTALTDFVAEYNRVQSLIDTQTATSTDAQGKVTAGVLANESDALAIASTLRNLTTSDVSGLSGILKRLDDLGIKSSGYDNSLTVSDGSKLDEMLANHLNEVKDLFSHAETGIASRLSVFVENTAGDEGTLKDKQDHLTDQSGDIDKQIVDMERFVQDERQRLINSFVAMESAQSKMNQQLQFLSQQLAKA